MNIDFESAKGGFTHTTEGKEAADGQKHLKVASKLTVSVEPDFMDEYLEGHNSGAQPTSVFWRIAPRSESKAMYPRYLGIEKMQLTAPANDRKYAVRIRSAPPNGWEGKEREFPGYLEAMLMGCSVKKVEVTTAPNACVVSLSIAVDNQQPEIATTLAKLSLLEDVLVDAWLMTRDMVDEMQKDKATPKLKDDAEVDEEEDEDPDAETAPE